MQFLSKEVLLKKSYKKRNCNSLTFYALINIKPGRGGGGAGKGGDLCL